ncbi:MAG: helix-turn-helix transcriptional regulator [Pseudomonadota bacterium]
MIGNKREYQITRSARNRFGDRIALIDRDLDLGNPEVAAERASLVTQVERLDHELAEFELLNSGQVSTFRECGVEGLSALLVKARIARGLNQKELADLLDVDERQVQRWEADEYERTAFWRLVDIADALA